MEVATDHTMNLSDENVARRLRAGIVFLMVALGLAALFETLGTPRLYRLTLFAPFFLSTNAFFQAIHKTCGFSALRGVRHTPEGDEPIADRRELSATRKQGLRQVVHAFVTATALSGVFYWLAG